MMTVKVLQGSRIYEYIATLTGCLGVISGAMHFGWPSPSLPYLLSEESHIPITTEDGSWLATMPCIGAAAGSVITAFFVDKIGRKNCMLLTAPAYLVGWLMVAFATTIWELYGARFLSGWADGVVFTAFPMYLGEIASPEIRGLLGSSLQLSMIIGMLLINIIGSYLSVTDTALVCAWLPPIFLATFWFMPESPYYLVQKGRMHDAEVTLQRLRRRSDVNEELCRVRNAVEKQDNNKFYELFTIASNRKAALIVFGLRAIQQFSGTTVITFYAQSIFEETGTIPPSVGSMVYFTLQLVCACASSFLVDKVGRKPLLIISIIGSGVMLAMEGVHFQFDTSYQLLPLVALLGYVITFNLGMGVIPVLMLGEMFPSNVKAFALCLADIWFGLIVTGVAKFFQIMQDTFGIALPFFAFSACCAIGLVFIVFMVPETKGRTLEEIQQELSHDKKTDLNRV